MATIATNGTVADVQAKHDLITTVDGDVLTLPSNVSTSGTWTLTFSGQTTSALAFNASAAAVASALNALSNIVAVGGVTVTGSMTEEFSVTFGANGAQPVMTSASSLVPTVTVTPWTKQVGTATKVAIQKVAIGASWNSKLLITKGITLQGNTTVTGTLGASGYTVTNNTLITDDAVNLNPLISVTLNTTQHFEISGITFQHGVGGFANGPMLITLTTVTAYNNNVRIHHCYFNLMERRLIALSGFNYGLVDHCHCALTFGAQILYANGGCNGPHEGWNDFARFGTDQFFFIEDNFLQNTGVIVSGVTDCSGGAFRYVMRKNYIVNGGTGDHGTEGSNVRGSRAKEWYDNTIEDNFGSHANVGPRGGNILFHDNTFVGTAGITDLGGPDSHRAIGGVSPGPYDTSTPSNWWGLGDGTSVWEKNVNTVTGNGVWQPGGTGLNKANQSFVDTTPASVFIFASGTCTCDDPIQVAPFGNLGTMKDASRTGGSLCVSGAGGSPWATNEWVGYSIHCDGVVSLCKGKGGYITANTGDTITFVRYGSTDRGPVCAFKAGDGYSIRRVLKLLDTAGSGKTDMVDQVGSTAVNHNTGTQSYIHMSQEPTLSWNNVTSPGGVVLSFTNGDLPMINMAGNIGVPGSDIYNLGGGLTTNHYVAVPTNAAAVLTAAVNGTDYTKSFPYPHYLQGTTTGKIIQLSGLGLAFGNVVVSTSATGTLTITNVGDTTITVTSVAYPTAFAGTTTGFTVGVGASVNRTVTFTPVSAIAYSGNITVNSDATVPAATIAVSGQGVTAGGGGSPTVRTLRVAIE